MMASAAYPYIDIVVLDAIRSRVIRGYSLVVLTPDFETVIWANGAGAQLFGVADLEDFLQSDPQLGATTIRQIDAAIAGRGSGRANLRLAPGFGGNITGCDVARIALPHGEPAVLIGVEVRGAGDIAQATVGGFSNPGTHVALLASQGDAILSSKGFDALGIAPAQLRELVTQARGETDRLVKRPLQTARGALPAAIARLSERPYRYLAMIVDDAVETVTAPPPVTADPEPPAQETIVAPPLAPDDVANDDTPPQSAAEDSGARDDHAETTQRTPLLSITENDDEPGGEDLSGPTAESDGQPTGDDDGIDSDDFVHDPEAGPVRFVWKTAPDGTFRDVSDEFARAVGPNAADVVGRSFEDVAAVFGLDPTGEIAALMTRRDTWSGRSVLWPVQGTDLKVPVDLAALPVYDRDRNFNGFRGFGVARMSDAMVDPDAIGLSLAPASGPRETANDGDKVIDLGSHRRDRSDAQLSESEASAFRAIGETLRPDAEPVAQDDDPGAPDAEPPEGDDGKPSAELPDTEPAADETPQDDEAEDAPMSRIAANAPPILRDGFVPSAFAKGDGPGHATLDEDVLAGLPIAILVHNGGEVHYVNEEFLRLSGYRSLNAFQKAGGLDALFSESDQPVTPRFGSPVQLVAVSGETIPVEARLHSVRWRDTVSLLLSMRALGDGVDADEEAAAPQAEPEITEDTPRHTPPAEPDSTVQLREARELRTILDTATDGVVLIDRQGRIRSLNRSAQALFGYDGEEMVGEPFQMLFAIESRPAANDYVQSLAENGITSVLNDGRELTAREKQGRFIPVFMTMGRLPESNGFCAVLRDITQFKRTETELNQARKSAERSSEQKSEFLARVSHEVRTPLNAIIGFSEIMLAESYGPIGNERYRDYLADINTSGNHVLQIINDLLDISKIEAGQQELDYEAVPLNDVITECVSIMQPAANRERVIMRTSLSPAVPDVVADLRSIRQIALNLLSNAIRYTQSGGQIIVSTTYDTDGDVIMRVRDTGTGMSDAEIEQALKPFKQVPSAKGRASGGTGLGLPLTKAMTEANRANFAIRSKPGEGTVVSITFPPQRVLAD